MLPQHVDHVITIFALLRAGIVWVPVNVHSKGDALAFIEHGFRYRPGGRPARPPRHISRHFRAGGRRAKIRSVIWRGRAGAELSFETLARGRARPPASPRTWSRRYCLPELQFRHDGRAQGSLVTDRGLRTGAQTCVHVAGIARGDVMLLWEPLYHLAGGQVPLIALLTLSTFALVPRFSASRFWAQAKQYGVTQCTISVVSCRSC